ncbi:S-adenosyl-L-methionine-dependent methyltransferase [Melanomma pulvis-pyrius CBS 109.77]|uniref:S-adenosyl-L-methionine-dependent methyltransferase n=1 Tax=Melanomma pulvis-pyrius CBS 109.77 TaxID=1314802 RepID=A0A6A6XFC7_9PLEO|nr:S-adenosyl-L-methionine-dependent methyltransferase [Melanomma pulvis-pyrius CBS 109.77]
MGPTDDKLFEKDKSFWDNYLKGRPKPPASLFRRIFDYHEAQGGSFGTVHDVGAGNGPFASTLASRFTHVILSDVAASNMELAKQRLGSTGTFTYRTARMDDIEGLATGSVDMIFASNVMHFGADQKATMAAMTRQLKPGGTFACAVFGPARFSDSTLQHLWEQISHQGGRELLKNSSCPQQTALILARTDGFYNVAPLDPSHFSPGALRVHLNMREGGLTPLLPPEMAHFDVEPNHTGPDDIETFEDEEGWAFEMDTSEVLEHMLSFPFVDPSSAAVDTLLKEVGGLIAEGNDGTARFRGWWPAKLILATVNKQ